MQNVTRAVIAFDESRRGGSQYTASAAVAEARVDRLWSGVARPQSPDYDRRRAGIVDAAAALYAKRGFQGASVADLAKACDTSKSLIYHYFPAKDDILHAVMAEHLDALVEAAEDGGERRQRRGEAARADLSLHAALCRRAGPPQGAAQRARQSARRRRATMWSPKQRADDRDDRGDPGEIARGRTTRGSMRCCSSG